MSFVTVLRSYATLADPARNLAPSVHLVSNNHAVTIFDKYPKARYHFLVLPRYPFTTIEHGAVGNVEPGELGVMSSFCP